MALAGLLHWRVAISCINVTFNLIILQKKKNWNPYCLLVGEAGVKHSAEDMGDAVRGEVFSDAVGGGQDRAGYVLKSRETY